MFLVIHSMMFLQKHPLEVFYKTSDFEKFAKFLGKHLCQSLFFNKETPAQMFSCEFGEIFKNTSFIEHLLTNVSIDINLL